MGKDPAMPFYVNDWLSSSRVARMTLEQQGAYMRLLCHCWASQDASLPADDDSLKALSGLGEGWLLNGSRLVRDCFEPHPTKQDHLTQERLFELWQERVSWREKSAAGGRKSGQSRKLKQSKGSCRLVGTKREPKGNSSSSSSSSIKGEANASPPSKPEPSKEDFELAKLMLSKIVAIAPNAIGTKPPQQPITISKWADTLRLMREQDGRAPPEIRKVFEWANRDSFWRSNILSANKLREKFDQLKLRMADHGGSRQDNSTVGTASRERSL